MVGKSVPHYKITAELAATLVSVQPTRILTINDEYADDYIVLHWWQNYARSLGE